MTLLLKTCTLAQLLGDFTDKLEISDTYLYATQTRFASHPIAKIPTTEAFHKHPRNQETRHRNDDRGWFQTHLMTLSSRFQALKRVNTCSSVIATPHCRVLAPLSSGRFPRTRMEKNGNDVCISLALQSYCTRSLSGAPAHSSAGSFLTAMANSASTCALYPPKHGIDLVLFQRRVP